MALPANSTPSASPSGLVAAFNAVVEKLGEALKNASAASSAFTNAIGQVTGAMGAVAGLVSAFDPALVILFHHAVVDLQAVLGEIVQNSFRTMLEMFKTFSAVLNSLGPDAKTLIADLLSGGVVVAAISAAFAVLSLVGGPLALVLALVAGAVMRNREAMESVSEIVKILGEAFTLLASVMAPIVSFIAKGFAELFAGIVKGIEWMIRKWNELFGDTFGRIDQLGKMPLTSAEGKGVRNVTTGSLEDIGRSARRNALRVQSSASPEVKAVEANGKKLDEIKHELEKQRAGFAGAAAQKLRDDRANADKPQGGVGWRDRMGHALPIVDAIGSLFR